MQIEDITWTFDGQAQASIDVSKAQGMIGPQQSITLASPVIARPLTDHEKLGCGEFKIIISIGDEFKKLVTSIKQSGSFDVLNATDQPVNFGLDVSAKVNVLEFTAVE